MTVSRFALFLGFWQGQPYLQAVGSLVLPELLGRRTFDVGNGAPCGHPADIARAHQLVRTQAVLVLQLAFEQVGEGGQADMRMLGNVHAFAGRVVMLQHMIEEHEGADAAKACRGQGTQNRLAGNILGARADQL